MPPKIDPTAVTTVVEVEGREEKLGGYAVVHRGGMDDWQSTNFRGFFVNARHLITVVTTFYYELETGLHYSTTSTHEGFRVPTITAAHPPLYRKAMKRLVGRSFLRSVIATLGCGVDIYGYRRLNCSKSSCLEHLGRRYKFCLAIENSNCRAYLTEKLFRTALRNDMVPIVMGGRPDDYFNLAPPNSYIHVDDFHSPAHLAEYLRYLDGNDTAYAAFFAWKALGTIRKASMTFCRLCALYHHGYLQQQGSSGGGVHLGHFEEHLNPWNLCIGARKWPSIANSALLSGRPLSLLFYLLFCLPVINWCLRSRA
uniref:Fucosyltransferase n=1 Tax=Echinococcus granulosus TaxID=6210 RepID=A0A068WTJ0_ECHGR|nr:glycoprotein 3 alpha L fucosyltransferase [Echinococcus granulosus]